MNKIPFRTNSSTTRSKQLDKAPSSKKDETISCKKFIGKVMKQYGKDVVEKVLTSKSKVVKKLKKEKSISKVDIQKIETLVKRTAKNLTETQKKGKTNIKTKAKKSGDLNAPSFLAELGLKAVDSKTKEKLKDMGGLALEVLEGFSKRKDKDFSLIEKRQLHAALQELRLDPAISGVALEDLTVLADVAEIGMLEHAVKEAKSQLLMKLKNIEKSGASQEISVTIQIGGGVSFAKANLELKINLLIQATDTSQVKTGHGGSLGLSAVLGKEDKLSAKGTLTGEVTKGTQYKTVEDFIDNNIESVVTTVLSKKISTLEGRSKAKRLTKLKNRANANLSRLEKHLKVRGHIGTDVSLVLTKKPKGKGVEYTTVGGEVEFEGKLGPIGLTVSASKEVTTFKECLPLLPTLKEHLGKDKMFDSLLEKNQTKIVAGSSNMNTLQVQKNTIIELVKTVNDPKLADSEKVWASKILGNVKQRLESDINSLYSSYQVYEQLVNMGDSIEGYFGSMGRLSGVYRSTKTSKTNFERSRNTKGRVDTLQSYILTHALLVNQFNIVSQALEGSEAKMPDNIVEMEDHYSAPRFKLSPGDVKKLNYEIQKQENVTKEHYSVSIFKQPFSVTVEESRDPKQKGEKPERSITIQVPGFIPSGKESIESFVKQLKSVPKLKGLDFSQLAKALTEGASVEIGTSTTLTLSYKQNEAGEYVLEYERLSGTLTTKVGIKDVPMGPIPLVGGFAIGGSSTEVLGERIGTNTLSYIEGKFNNWMDGKKMSKWGEFTKSNQKGLTELLVHISSAKKGTNLQKEIEELASKMKDGGKLAENLKNACAQLAKNPKKQELFDNAMKALNGFFKQYNIEVNKAKKK